MYVLFVKKKKIICMSIWTSLLPHPFKDSFARH